MNPSSISRSLFQDFLQNKAKVFITQQSHNLSRHYPHRHFISCATRITPSNNHVKQNMVSAVACSYHGIHTSFTIRSLSSDNKSSSSSSSTQNTAETQQTETNDSEQPTENNTPEQEEQVQTPSKEQVEKLQAELKEMKDQLLRSLAEQENIRRIAQRDVENARNFAVSSFAKSLLDTSDNLTRAMDAVPEEYRQDNEEHPVLATLYEGIRMTDDGLTKAFAKNGLKKFGERGDKFDPNRHDALFEYMDETLEPGTVGQVMKVGYTLNNRVIRPAEVGVVKKS
mmetsp:Transcript_8739/g.16490  ORF Transcript_8739/g.16490 Transcript_8739/m.16490 type:complete len:283 (+) Transcript_8739:128-976(+)